MNYVIELACVLRLMTFQPCLEYINRKCGTLDCMEYDLFFVIYWKDI